MFNRNGDLEQKPAKSDDADAKSPEHHGFDLGRAFKQAGDAIGQVQNDMIERVTNAHVKQQYVASVSPALANQYVHGRDIMASRGESGKSTTDLSDLSAAEKQAVQTYQRLHSDLPSKIPFYNKETLANDLDRDIVRKARSQPEVRAAATVEAKPSSKPIRPESRSEAKPDRKPDSKPDSKLAPRLETNSKPEAKPALRSDQLREPASVAKQDVRGTTKPGAEVEKPDTKRDSRPDLRPDPKLVPQLDQRPATNPSEKTTLDRTDNKSTATILKGELAKPEPPGNALLTALGKNKVEGQTGLSPQPVVQRSENKKDTSNTGDLSETKKTTDGIHSQSKSKAESKPDPKPESSITPSYKQHAQCERREEKKTLSSTSTSEHSKSSNIRLVPASQSHVAIAHLDGAIKVVRQLSDRIPCSTIQVVVKPTMQSSTTIDHRPNAPKTVKNSQQIDSSKRPEHKAEFKPKLNAEHSSEPRPDSKAEPKPLTKIDVKGTPRIESKSDYISGSRPSSSPNSPAFKPEGVTSKSRQPELDNRINADTPLEPFVDSQGKVLRGYRLKCQDADLKYITGSEIALSAIIAIASITKLRTDQNMWQGDPVALVETFGSTNFGSQINDSDRSNNSNLDSPLSAKLAAINESNENRNNDTEIRKNDYETRKSVFIRPKILIGSSDSLVSISEQLFNDAGIAWLILQLNNELRPLQIEGKTVVRLRSRQEIFIPVYQDIIDFQKSRTKEMSGNNLITVVEENQIDREIVDLAMAPMLGHNSTNVDPLQSLQPLRPLLIVADNDNSEF